MEEEEEERHKKNVERVVPHVMPKNTRKKDQFFFLHSLPKYETLYVFLGVLYSLGYHIERKHISPTQHIHTHFLLPLSLCTNTHRLSRRDGDRGGGGTATEKVAATTRTPPHRASFVRSFVRSFVFSFFTSSSSSSSRRVSLSFGDDVSPI